MRALTLVLLLSCLVRAQDWPCYGNDPGASRYSALAEINRQNVYGLEQAWECHTGELERYRGTTAFDRTAFECTPLMVGGRLYLTTPSCRVLALDPTTGGLLWSYDPGVDLMAPFPELTSRGLAQAGGLLFLGTVDARLIALDAGTGKLAWTVPLSQGVTSAPAVLGEVVVVGSGPVRGYHCRTGRLLWSWDSEPGLRAWAPLAADPELGLVYVPTGAPGRDSSIVALHASTGQVAWAFQTVHHDLWGYDNAAGPVLVTLNRQTKRLAAVAVATKMGRLFVLDRATGQPLFAVEEREVPGGGPLQPISPDLPTLGLHEVHPWGLTREKQDFARDWIGGLRWEGTFTPPSEQGSIVAPSNLGGSDWSGMAFDPVRGLLLLNVNRIANVLTPGGGDCEYLVDNENGKLPYTRPPWGTLAAVDLADGRLRWEVPLGWMLNPGDHPMAARWGAINLGGTLVTAGGLTFVAATPDNHLRAFDTESGQVLWQRRLPASAQAAPMTYSVNGRQYVVICAGGHARLGTRLGDSVLAFRLPNQ